MTFVLGLTGSIGMGKTTTASLFADMGIPVWDADATVHQIYAPGGAAIPGMAQLFPAAVIDGAVSRAALKHLIAADSSALKLIEALVHPLVARDRADFLLRHPDDIVLLDIPLLFETGADTNCDATAVVSTAPEIQRARVLARPGMTEASFQMILQRQMPDADKRARADYIIDTTTPDLARAGVLHILSDIRTKLTHA